MAISQFSFALVNKIPPCTEIHFFGRRYILRGGFLKLMEKAIDKATDKGDKGEMEGSYCPIGRNERLQCTKEGK